MSALLLHGSVSPTSWHLEPTVVGGALIVFGVYLYGLNQEERADWRRVGFFLAGALSMLLALISPLDAAAHRLLSMHMLEHVILTTIGPPLVLLGLPRALVRPLFRDVRLGTFARLATSPVVAGPLFIVNMWLWHAPPVYQEALTVVPVHAFMHVSFMATGLLFWWPVIQPLPEETASSDAARLLYLLSTCLPMALLALLLMASNTVVYDFYLKEQRLWGLSAIEDQQIAGLIMGALGEAAGFVAISLLFFRFLDREEALESA